MSSAFRCPRCQCRLRVPVASDSRWLTCPRCLSSVRSPQLPDDSDTAIPVVPLAVETARGDCPGCGKSINPSWRLCPACGQPLQPTRRPRRGQSMPEADANRDFAAVNQGLLVLGALFWAVGILWFARAGVHFAPHNNALNLFFNGATVLTLFVAGLLAFGAGIGNATLRWLARGIGFVIMLMGLAGLVVVSLVVALVETCNFR